MVTEAMEEKQTGQGIAGELWQGAVEFCLQATRCRKDPHLEPDAGYSDVALGKLLSLFETQERTASTSLGYEGSDSGVCQAPAQAGPRRHGGGDVGEPGRHCRLSCGSARS